MITKEKIKVFYLENKKTIMFFSYHTQDILFILNKTKDNFEKFNKILNSNKYEFIKLIK